MKNKKEFKSKLHRKILFYLGFSVLSILIIVIWLFGSSMYKTMLSDRLYTLEIYLKSLVDKLEDSNGDAVSAIKFIAFAQESGFFDKRKFAINHLKRTLNSMENASFIFVAYEKSLERDAEFLKEHPELSKVFGKDGRFAPCWVRDKDEPDKFKLQSVKNWQFIPYKEIKNSIDKPLDKRIVSAPPFKADGETYFTIYFPIVLNDKFSGFVGIGYSFKKVVALFKKYKDLTKNKLFSSAQFFLYDEKNQLIVDSMKSDNLKVQKDVQEVLFDKNTKNNLVKKKINGENYFLTFHKVNFDLIGVSKWTVVMSVLEEEVLLPIQQVLLKVIIFALFGAIFIFLILRKIISSVTKPIRVAAGSAKKIAEGDLTFKVAVESDDEMGALLNSFDIMTHKLHSLISKVNVAVSQVVKTSQEMMITSDNQEKNVQQFSQSTHDVYGISQSISNTSLGLVKDVDSVSSTLQEANVLASTGSEALVGMEKTMRLLATHTDKMVARFAVLMEKVNGIGSIIETIANVSDDTDVLSLNAAVEAAKAGENGLGFEAVAKEVRRLSDQTSYAADDVETMIKDMQKAVKSEMSSMSSFAKEVHSVVDEMEKIRQQLFQIIKQVQAIVPYFKGVDSGMRSQLLNTQKIDDSMSKLNEVAKTSEDSMLDLKKATGHLEKAADDLKVEISKFKLKPKL